MSDVFKIIFDSSFHSNRKKMTFIKDNVLISMFYMHETHACMYIAIIIYSQFYYYI